MPSSADHVEPALEAPAKKTRSKAGKADKATTNLVGNVDAVGGRKKRR